MTGYLTTAFGYITALDIIVIAFQLSILVLTVVMPETCMHKMKK
jgi:hypothetical protein